MNRCQREECKDLLSGTFTHTSDPHTPAESGGGNPYTFSVKFNADDAVNGMFSIPLSGTTSHPGRFHSDTFIGLLTGTVTTSFPGNIDDITTWAFSITGEHPNIPPLSPPPPITPYPVTTVPEPITMSGSATALGFGAFFKRKLKPSKSSEKETIKVS